MSGAEDTNQDRHPQCFDPLYATPAHRPHVNDRSREYKVGAAFMAACEAIKHDTVLLSVFVEQLKAVACNERGLDAAQKVVVEAWKERAG